MEGWQILLGLAGVMGGVALLARYALRKIDQGAPGWGGPNKELTHEPQNEAAPQDPPAIDLMPGQAAPRQVSVQKTTDRVCSGEREDAPLRDVRPGGEAVSTEASKKV